MLEEIRNGELFYNGVSLAKLADKYGTPLKITFLDIIKDHVSNLKNSFDNAIKKLDYSGKFIYLNANKANYGAMEIASAFEKADGLETSSYYDLLMSNEMFKKYPQFKDKYLVSNGYKPNDYLDAIINISKEHRFIDVIDSYDEYERLKKANVKMEVGLRVHLSALYCESENDPKDDRFGLMHDEFVKIIKDIGNTKLKLTMIHFHQRGFDYEEEKFKKNFLKAFEDYYVYACKHIDTVCNFNMGGGTPSPIDYKFDYNKWAQYVIGLLKDSCKKYGICEPNLFSENGRYSQKDSAVNVYSVITKKNTGEYPWHIVDGSLLIAMPEYYALGESIIVRPINALDKKMIKARLAGVTCDCDDVYYEKKGYVDLPDNEKIYIGLIGTGSYQNSMNGKGGIHHCLLPEEKDVLVYNDGNNIKSTVRKQLQSIDEVLRLMQFNDLQNR